jgi:magnesium chelatase family protein
MPKVYSATLVGLSAEVVEVEADVSPGLPATVIVGLPDTSVQEARERVKFSIRNSNALYPRNKVVVNLAPADLPKNGSHFDLPIALSILLNSGQIDFNSSELMIIGELALDGAVRSVVGLLPVILSARQKGFKKIIIPAANTMEAALVTGIEIIPVDSLVQVIGYLQGLIKIKPLDPIAWEKVLEEPREVLDFKLISGQESVKRALEIAAAGGHNLLLTGPPGTGKTLLAKALPSILPRLTVEEVLEITKIYSIAGLLTSKKGIITNRPFRSPHHSASAVSLVGGGSNPKPGEISLAHRGVLFLDELPEFSRMVLENLRQPLEEGRVTVSRSSGTVVFPASFILIAAQNPCPCGYLNNINQECICTNWQIINYQKRVSGPMLDRMDLFIEVSGIEYDKLASNESSETSASVQARVQMARNIQAKRFANSKIITNSEMGVSELKMFCSLAPKEKEFIKDAAIKLNLSARAYHRVLKLARTIADLSEDKDILINHLAEAIQYRTKSE